MEVDRIIVAQVVGGEGEADDGSVFDHEDAAARAAFVVVGEFERGGDFERGELAAGGVEEGFGVGKFLDHDDARVERGGGRERARRRDTEV